MEKNLKEKKEFLIKETVTNLTEFNCLLANYEDEHIISEKNKIYNQLTLLAEIMTKELFQFKNNDSIEIKLKQEISKILFKFKNIKNISQFNKSLPEINFSKKESINDEKNNNLQFQEYEINDEEFIRYNNEDNSIEINELLTNFQGINKTAKEISLMTAEQSENIDLIDIETAKAKTQLNKANIELKNAAVETINNRKSKIKIFFMTLGGLIGIKGGPIGVGVGMGVGTAVGAGVSMGLNPLKNKINNLDEIEKVKK